VLKSLNPSSGISTQELVSKQSALKCSLKREQAFQFFGKAKSLLMAKLVKPLLCWVWISYWQLVKRYTSFLIVFGHIACLPFTTLFRKFRLERKWHDFSRRSSGNFPGATERLKR